MGWVFIGLLMLFAAFKAEPALGYVFFAGLVIWAAAIYFHPSEPEPEPVDEITAKIQADLDAERAACAVAEEDLDRTYQHALDEIRKHLHK